VDHHALANHGITLRGGINTLGLVRWVMPHLINEPGRFKLKALMLGLLQRNPTCTFIELLSYERQVFVSTWKKQVRRECSCGEEGCRKRKGHVKFEEEDLVEVVKEKTERGRYNLWDIVPGHERWELLVKYSLDDAVAALNVLDLCEAGTDPAPWPYGGSRPGFNQGAEESVIAMEAIGFDTDVDWCRETAAVAVEMETDTLEKLHRWFVRNAPTHGPHRREDVDPVWASGVKKIALFDDLCFPRSPVWKKGRVKRGKWCLDGVAMEWIARNHPAAKQVADLLLHLQRIRSGKKYLEKLRDSGGRVHPICGPAGDDDERAGAVTGRLGIKGQLEAQQLPKEGEKDLFGVRKAIIAGPGETLLTADYSSLEIGIQGDFAVRLFGDDQIVQMYIDQARGVDMHSNNARNVFGKWLGWLVPAGMEYAGQTVDAIPVEVFKKHEYGAVLRGLIKTVHYGMAYGKGAYGFSTLIGADGKMIGEEMAGKMVEALLSAVPAMRAWFRWVEKYVKANHGIYSLGGRWCDLSSEMETGEEWQERRAYRRGYNFPFQATGAEIIGDAMVRVMTDEEFRALGYRVCLQVHDELVCRGPIENLTRAAEILVKHMTEATANGTPLLFPIQVSWGYGANYGEAK
jgi:hypothetical protein